jgi:hypothetical protein
MKLENSAVMSVAASIGGGASLHPVLFASGERVWRAATVEVHANDLRYAQHAPNAIRELLVRVKGFGLFL